MRYSLILLFFLLLPGVLTAQISITATQGTGYYLVTDVGDTLHLRGQTPYYNTYRIAVMDAAQHSAETGDIVYIRNNMDERLWADFGYFDDYYDVVYDTVYVEITDTIFVETEVPVPGDTVYVTKIETDTVYVETEVEVSVPGDTVYVELPGDTLYVEVIDTVFVGQDTIYFEHKDHNLPVHHEWSHHLSASTGQSIEIEFESMGTHSRIDYYCKDPETDKHSLFASSDHFQHEPFELVTDRVYTDCDTEFMYMLRTSINTPGAWSFQKYTHIPIGLLQDGDFLDPEPEPYDPPEDQGIYDPEKQFYLTPESFQADQWVQHWDNNALLYVHDGELILDIPDRSASQLWQWTQVPESPFMEAYVKVRKADGTNNLHLRLLADTDIRTSQDIYLSTSSILYNWWDNGSWGSGASVEFSWQPGDIVHKVIRQHAGMIYAKAWHDGDPEPDWMLVTTSHNPPASGFFGIGSHNPGTRYILELGVAIDGLPAPRYISE